MIKRNYINFFCLSSHQGISAANLHDLCLYFNKQKSLGLISLKLTNIVLEHWSNPITNLFECMVMVSFAKVCNVVAPMKKGM